MGKPLPYSCLKTQWNRMSQGISQLNGLKACGRAFYSFCSRLPSNFLTPVEMYYLQPIQLKSTLTYNSRGYIIHQIQTKALLFTMQNQHAGRLPANFTYFLID